MNTAKVVNISEKLSLISEHWQPHIIAELNGQHVKLVKFKGEFVMHNHEDEDELFLVISGCFRMEFDNETIILNEGELVVVPRGVNHRPVADEEVCVLLFEPASTLNTGNVRNEFTRDELKSI